METYYVKKGKKKIKKTRKVINYKITYSQNPLRGTETYIWAADRSKAKSEFISTRMAEEVEGGEYMPNMNDPEFKAKSLLWTKRFFDKSLFLGYPGTKGNCQKHPHAQPRCKTKE